MSIHLTFGSFVFPFIIYYQRFRISWAGFFFSRPQTPHQKHESLGVWDLVLSCPSRSGSWWGWWRWPKVKWGSHAWSLMVFWGGLATVHQRATDCRAVLYVCSIHSLVVLHGGFFEEVLSGWRFDLRYGVCTVGTYLQFSNCWLVTSIHTGIVTFKTHSPLILFAESVCS